MRTVIHTYQFDTRKADERAAYVELAAKLSAGPHCMKSHGQGSHYMPELSFREIELETEHLFDNQWNTAPIEGVSDKGLRVFDWAEDAIFDRGVENTWLKQGHWLEQTAEMREIRRNTHKCGYCGKQEPAAKGYVFCPHCIDSEYLTEKDLPLTRMLPVDSPFGTERAPLSEAERAHLLPLFREAQLHGTTERGKARRLKQRADIAAKAKSAIENATAERDGMLWLLDHGVNIDNVIFYSHTGRFGFGWRKPVDAALYSQLCDILCEFPFDYDIKREG